MSALQQARALMGRLVAAYRRLLTSLATAARRAVAAIRAVYRAARQARTALTLRDRPAWQSPYGPPQRRH